MNMALLAIAPAIGGLLIVSAAFAAAETALTGASRNRMHQLEREGDRAAVRVNRLIARRDKMISSLLLGNTLINILASAIVTAVLTQIFPGGLGVAAATAMMTLLVLMIFAEVLPEPREAIARSTTWPDCSSSRPRSWSGCSGRWSRRCRCSSRARSS